MNILLIDDELDFCLQARDYLEKFGHQVTIETTGSKAYAVFEGIAPSIVIVDVDLGLTSTDGRTICAEIAKSDSYIEGKVGIVMISGHYIAPNDEVLGFQVGADNYLVKPFELSQLLARVNALGRRFSSRVVDELHIDDDLTIKIAAREVWFQGVQVNLSKLEFNVLLFLAQPTGTTRTKSDLLQSVWGTSHIEEGAIATDRYVKTVYGVGYKLMSSDKADA